MNEDEWEEIRNSLPSPLKRWNERRLLELLVAISIRTEEHNAKLIKLSKDASTPFDEFTGCVQHQPKGEPTASREV